MTEQCFLTSGTCLALACAAFGFIAQVERQLLLPYRDRRRALFSGGVSSLVLVVCLVGCGDGTTTTGPTSPENSFLAGTWRGSVMVHRDGLPDTTGTTTWTFQLVPNTGGASFTTTITVEHPWLAIPSATVTSGLYAPTTPGARISTVGSYASPRGCVGAIGSTGMAYQGRIEADLSGSDCLQLPETSVFSGTVTLTRSR
jgi:hypothetical protein